MTGVNLTLPRAFTGSSAPILPEDPIVTMGHSYYCTPLTRPTRWRPRHRLTPHSLFIEPSRKSGNAETAQPCTTDVAQVRSNSADIPTHRRRAAASRRSPTPRPRC
jgi:hypothetical protein